MPAQNFPSHSAQPLSASALSATAIRRLVSRDIRTPLAALRACLETLSKSLQRDAAASVVNHAIEQLFKVEQAAEVLCESAYPRLNLPSRCSVEEILRNAWRGLTTSERAQVGLAIEEAPHYLDIDAELLARSLTHLIRGLLADQPTEFLVHASTRATDLVIATVDNLPCQQRSEFRSSLDHSSDNAMRAEVALAVREIHRLGGQVSLSDSESDHTRVLIRIPSVVSSEVQS